MTPQNRRTLAFTVYASVLGLLAWGALSGMARQLVLRPEFEMHVQTEAQRLDEVKGIALDILCDKNPTHWRCK